MTVQESIVGRWEAGAISREIALAQLLLTGDVPDPATLPVPIADLARQHADRLGPLATLARGGFDADSPDATAALFDRLAAEAPDAGVAFYTLGDPALVAAATAELVAVIEAWAPIAGRDVLDYGCGTGRVACALAPRARSVLGIDLSPAMVALAASKASGHPRPMFRQSDGRSISAGDGSFDAVVVADSLPFVVQAGGDAVEAAFAEFARVLRPGGDLLVFNWSYRGDPGRDAADARVLADRHGFALLRADEAPFAIWDGRGFHLRRR